MVTLDEIAKTLHRLEEEIKTIKRGVYGDEPNGVRGLIATDRDQHVRIKKLETIKSRVLWTTLGFVLCLEGLFLILKLLFT